MSEQEHPFQPGVEVVVTKGWGGARKIAMGRVAKVYKTGKFTIEGSAQQYRAFFDDSTKEWRGNQTGSSYYPLTVYLPSKKWEAKAAQEAMAAKLRATLNEVDAQTRHNLHSVVESSEVVAAAETLLAAIRAAKERTANADAA